MGKLVKHGRNSYTPKIIKELRRQGSSCISGMEFILSHGHHQNVDMDRDLTTIQRLLLSSTSQNLPAFNHLGSSSTFRP